MSKREFQTEVSQLLQLIVHSLYSHPEIFLRELISNSSDALDKLRHLTLTDEAYKSLPFDPRIDLDLDETNKTLTIADTGIGMSPQDVQVALTPFGQVDNRLERKYEGTGLGLPLAKKFIELHGGALAVESTPSEGTAVTITLPRIRCLEDAALQNETNAG